MNSLKSHISKAVFNRCSEFLLIADISFNLSKKWHSLLFINTETLQMKRLQFRGLKILL